LLLEALETGPQEGYEFSVIADAEQDMFVTFRRLFERIRRELGRKHIEKAEEGYQITDAGVVRGQISSDPDAFDRMPLLIIDRKPVTWDALGRMLSSHEGFRFKLEIFDRSEERSHDPRRCARRPSVRLSSAISARQVHQPLRGAVVSKTPTHQQRTRIGRRGGLCVMEAMVGVRAVSPF
jgi:hypothetical protein